MISLVVAQAKNRVIGRSNDLPWYLPADLRHFKELTTGHTVIMGRKTWDSIVARLGHGLPNRTNIVVTRNQDLKIPDVTVAHSFNEAVRTAGEGELFVIGGAAIFEAALPLADRIYMTQVQADVEGDVQMPELGPEWREIHRESHLKDDKNQYDYDFVTLEKTEN